MPERIHFETTEELLKIDRVARFSERPGFSHYALCNEIVLAVFNGGAHWHVAGYVGKPDRVDLPQWTHPRYAGNSSK